MAQGKEETTHKTKNHINKVRTINGINMPKQLKKELQRAMLSITLPPKMVATLRERAKRVGGKVSGQIEIAVRDYLEQIEGAEIKRRR